MTADSANSMSAACYWHGWHAGGGHPAGECPGRVAVSVFPRRTIPCKCPCHRGQPGPPAASPVARGEYWPRPHRC